MCVSYFPLSFSQDIAQFGGNKCLSVCIALLDTTTNDASPCLTYKAASDDCIYHVLGKKINRGNAPVIIIIIIIIHVHVARPADT